MTSTSVGQVLGAISGLACATLSVWLVYDGPPAPFRFKLIISTIGLGGVLAALAALRRAPFALVVIFVVSFLPFSAYLLLSPGPFRWFGILECGYLVSAMMVRKS